MSDAPKGFTGAGSHSGTPVGGADGHRIAEEFRAERKARHLARIAKRAEERKQARVSGLSAGFIGPPNPYAMRKSFRPPMK